MSPHPPVADDQYRCTYQPGVLRCIRRVHPEDPDAHIRDALTLDDRDNEGEQP